MGGTFDVDLYHGELLRGFGRLGAVGYYDRTLDKWPTLWLHNAMADFSK